MYIGIPKERRPFEYRVGLPPAGVEILKQHGHDIFVEHEAGLGAGFPDADYEHAGARIVYSSEEVFGRADFLLKIARPVKEEIEWLRPGSMIAGLLHLASARQDKIDLMRSLAASEWQIFYLVKLPNALPFIFAGLEMGAVYSLIGAIVGEFIGGEVGLGVLIMQMNLVMDIAGVFATLIILSAVGIAFHIIIQAIEKKLIFWSPKHIETISA